MGGSRRTDVAIDAAIFVACLAAPWLASGWARPLVALGALAAWIAVARPTWRGLAPFFLTAALGLHALVQAVLAAL